MNILDIVRQIADSNIVTSPMTSATRQKGVVLTSRGMFTVVRTETGKMKITFEDRERNAVIVETNQKDATHLITAVRKYYQRAGL